MAATRDPYIGEIFLDLDERTFQRRIRITGFKDDPNTPEDESGFKFWPRVVKTFSWTKRPKYRYVVVSNGGYPGQEGRKGTISAKTLARRYQKVSH